MSEDDIDRYCPGCDSVCILYLGTLGYTRHFRCRDCGSEFAETIKPRKPKVAAGATRKSPWGDPVSDRPDKWLET